MKRPTLARPPASPDLALVPRIFAVSAAILLVGSVALAALLPGDTSLVQALRSMDAAAPAHLERAVTGILGHAIWSVIAMPLLVRPVWMIPVSLGLICVGGAVTALTQASARPRQRRS